MSCPPPEAQHRRPLRAAGGAPAGQRCGRVPRSHDASGSAMLGQDGRMARPRKDAAQPTAEPARDALRWVASQSVPAEGGLAWLRPNWPERRPADDLYEGTAGVLVGLAEARLTGITEFDDVAQAAAGRLKWLVGRVVAAGGPTDDFAEL